MPIDFRKAIDAARGAVRGPEPLEPSAPPAEPAEQELVRDLKEPEPAQPTGPGSRPRSFAMPGIPAEPEPPPAPEPAPDAERERAADALANARSVVETLHREIEALYQQGLTAATREEVENCISEIWSHQATASDALKKLQDPSSSFNSASYPDLFVGSDSLYGQLMALHVAKNVEHAKYIDELLERAYGQLAHSIPSTPFPDVDQARTAYLKAQKEHNALYPIRKFFGLSKDTQVKMDKAEADYQKARGEYVAASLDRYLEERSKLAEERFKIQAQQKGKFKKAYEWYKKLSDVNLDSKVLHAEGRTAKFLGRAVNVKTVTSLSLLGVGFIAGGPASWVGLGALGVRKGLSWAASTSGSYELMQMARNGLNRSKIERDIQGLQTLGDIEGCMAELESRALLDGKSYGVLQKDELYSTLLRKREEQIKIEMPAGGVQSIQEYLDRQSAKVDKSFQDIVAGEQGKRFGTAVAASTLGALVASGELQKRIAHAFFGDTSPEGDALQRPQSQAPGEVRQAPEPSVPSAEHPMAQPHVDHVPETQLSVPESQAPIETPKIPATGEIHEPAVPETTAPSAVPSTTETAPALPVPDAQQPPVHAAVEVPKPPHEAIPDNAVRMRAGAWAETKGDDLFVHAGQRGIEGALLDLQRTDSEKFAAMTAWLKSQGDLVNANDPEKEAAGRMLHRLIAKVAHEQGWSVGDGSDTDITQVKNINKIFAAGIQVKADGSIHFGADSVQFMPPEAAETVSAPSGAPSAGKVFDAGTLHSAGEEKFVLPEPPRDVKLSVDAVAESSPQPPHALTPEEILQRPGIPDRSIPEVAKFYAEHPDLLKSKLELEQSRAMLEEARQQHKNVEAARKAFEEKYARFEETTKAMRRQSMDDIDASAEQLRTQTPSASASAEIAYQQALETPKLSDGLEQVLGGQYREFMDKILPNISSEELDGIKDLTLEQFLRKMQAVPPDTQFTKKFAPLFETIVTISENNAGIRDPQYIGTMSVKKFLLQIAPKIMNIK